MCITGRWWVAGPSYGHKVDLMVKSIVKMDSMIQVVGGGNTVTIFGSRFEAHDYTPSASIGETGTLNPQPCTLHPAP